MNKDVLTFILSGAGFVVSATSAIYQYQIVAIVLAAAAIVAYLGYLIYVMHRLIPGNTWLRLAPVVVLVVSAGVMYRFWPATLNVTILDGETPIAQEEVTIKDSAKVLHQPKTDASGQFSIPVSVGSSRVDLQACKLEYSIVSPK